MAHEVDPLAMGCRVPVSVLGTGGGEVKRRRSAPGTFHLFLSLKLSPTQALVLGGEGLWATESQASLFVTIKRLCVPQISTPATLRAPVRLGQERRPRASSDVLVHVSTRAGTGQWILTHLLANSDSEDLSH